MRDSGKLSYVTVEEYLAQEATAEMKHEYVDGRVFAMTGTSHRHNTIVLNIYRTLHARLSDSGCRAYVCDLKVRVERANSFYYPDVVVTCGKYDPDSYIISEPTLIIEVLSASTQTIDRREKVIAYRQIDSLKEYLIVHQRRQCVELHRKNQAGGWDVFQFAKGGEVTLESLPPGSLMIPLAAFYEDAFPPDLQVHEATTDWDADSDW